MSVQRLLSVVAACAVISICIGCGGGSSSTNIINHGGGSNNGGGNNNGNSPPPRPVAVTVNVQIPGMQRGLSSKHQTRSLADVGQFALAVTDQSGQSLATASVPYAYPQATVTLTCSVAPGPARIFTVTGSSTQNGAEFTGSTTADVSAGMGDVSIAVKSPAADVSTGGILIDPSGKPGIVYDSVPPLGKWGVPLLGHETNVLPTTCKTITFIYVVGSWWVKPYYNTPFSPVNPDGSFSVDITTGGVDQDAKIIKTWLVTADYAVPKGLPPDPAPGNGVLAVTSVNR